MLKSRANALWAVYRVTQQNKGRLTPGVDGLVVLDDQSRAAMASWLAKNAAATTPSPVRRVYIPKANGKRRPLGIPTLIDRAYQAMVRNALEPEWEARFEPDVYGFRPGRGCHDAIAAIFNQACRRTSRRLWVLDADLRAAFDNIDHDHLLTMLDGFPAKGHIRAWLKAGVMEHGEFEATEAGTPQGGIISPLLLNIAMHGMEKAAGTRRTPPQWKNGGDLATDTPALIRYADDFVVMCQTREQAQAVQARLAEWFRPRGLAFNEDKTRIAHLSDGFDFLGFNIRRYRNGTLLIKPSKAAQKRIRAKLGAELTRLNGANADAVIATINPIIRGWTAYYRNAVSSEVFNSLDSWLWRRLWRWAYRAHPGKGARWIAAHYWGRFNPRRADRWVFGSRTHQAYAIKFAWTHIRRHEKVSRRASKDDPALTDYWRRRARHDPFPITHLSTLPPSSRTAPALA